MKRADGSKTPHVKRWHDVPVMRLASNDILHTGEVPNLNFIPKKRVAVCVCFFCPILFFCLFNVSPKIHQHTVHTGRRQASETGKIHFSSILLQSRAGIDPPFSRTSRVWRGASDEVTTYWVMKLHPLQVAEPTSPASQPIHVGPDPSA